MKFTFDKALYQKLIGFVKKYKYLIIVAAAGIILLLIPTGSSEKTQTTAEQSVAVATDDTSLGGIAARIQEVLEQIEGVGKTEVVLTLKSGTETLYATDTRNDTTETVVISAGSGTQQAVVTVKNYPTYQGALVVCDGGGSPSVRLEVTKAVAALTGLTADKITVSKRESAK